MSFLLGGTSGFIDVNVTCTEYRCASACLHVCTYVCVSERDIRMFTVLVYVQAYVHTRMPACEAQLVACGQVVHFLVKF